MRVGINTGGPVAAGTTGVLLMPYWSCAVVCTVALQLYAEAVDGSTRQIKRKRYHRFGAGYPNGGAGRNDPSVMVEGRKIYRRILASSGVVDAYAAPAWLGHG